MHIILRLICENLSIIAVKISFLWGRIHCVYAAASFAAIVTSCYLRNDIQNFTVIILYMNIICNAQWLYGANFEIIHRSDAFSRCKNLFKHESTFKQARVDFFYRENMTSFLNYVTATLRALFAWRGSCHCPANSYIVLWPWSRSKVTIKVTTWYHRKGFVTKNTHAKYKSSTCKSAKVTAKVKVFVTDRRTDGQTDE